MVLEPRKRTTVSLLEETYRKLLDAKIRLATEKGEVPSFDETLGKILAKLSEYEELSIKCPKCGHEFKVE